jgi:glycolate oxidase
MALNRDFYGALEEVVGAENVSEDPVILSAYLWKGRSAAQMGGILPQYKAVTLPKTTSEVQSIVKLCNKSGVQFKGTSTGWGPSNAPGERDSVLMDLRRMNRILEINEKNMYAVVEPYVTGAQLQAELMKRGFFIVLNGAGAQCSALPLAASTGHGFTSVSLGYAPKNVKAVEWVKPDGEIVATGSAGSSGEWFSGDGPGPSLKGLIRSSTSPAGGLGVFTKASLKIYHWPGPTTFPIEGVSPLCSCEIPSFRWVHLFCFGGQAAGSGRKICESEIACN